MLSAWSIDNSSSWCSALPKYFVQLFWLKTQLTSIIDIQWRASYFITLCVSTLAVPVDRRKQAAGTLWERWLAESLCPVDIIKCWGTLLAHKVGSNQLLLGDHYHCQECNSFKFLPIKLIFPLHYIIERGFWSGRTCIPLAAKTKHCICCSILVTLQCFVEAARLLFIDLLFCLPSSAQSVLTHCPSNLISHAAFKWRSRPWPPPSGWQLSDTDSRLQILAAKTLSFIPVTDHWPQLEAMLYSRPISWQEIYILY